MRPLSASGTPTTSRAMPAIATAGQRAPLSDPSSQPRISRYESPVTVQKMTKLVIAPAKAETATPGEHRAGRGDASEGARQPERQHERRDRPGECGDRQQDRDAEQQNAHRPERGPG